MRLFTWRFIRVWQRNRDVFFRLWHSEAPGFIIEPLLTLLIMGLGLGAYIGLVDGQKYIDFIAPGLIAGYVMFSAIFECTYGTFVRMEYQKTFDSIISTPLNVEDVTAGEIFWGASRALLTGVVMLIMAAIFQLVHSPWALLVPILCFMEGLMFASIATLFTSLVPYIYSFNYFYTLFVTPMFYLSGVFFPLDSFPQVIQIISWFLPLTSSSHLIRSVMAGEFNISLLGALAIMIVITCLSFALSLITMRKRLTR